MTALGTLPHQSPVSIALYLSHGCTLYESRKRAGYKRRSLSSPHRPEIADVAHQQAGCSSGPVWVRDASQELPFLEGDLLLPAAELRLRGLPVVLLLL
jgi:hypothetical protein